MTTEKIERFSIRAVRVLPHSIRNTMIDIACPRCGTSLLVNEDLIGRVVFCLGCGMHFTIRPSENGSRTVHYDFADTQLSTDRCQSEDDD